MKMELIHYEEEEIVCIYEKEKSIEGLLQSAPTQFAKLTFNLYRRYYKF